ncbi:ABC transporter ATP-binding protein [Dietzia sp. ANT_WB102]|nr:ABC transporter ATP-binding protein [Dietzia sp. ANT_WB102]
MCHGRSLLSGDVDDLRDDWGASLAPTFRETYQ